MKSTEKLILYREFDKDRIFKDFTRVAEQSKEKLSGDRLEELQNL